MSAPTEPVTIGTQISIGATFSDVGAPDTHMAVWEWGDGATSTGSVTEAGGAGVVAGLHTYSGVGVYTVALTLTDKDGASTRSDYRYVVVYDPEGGYVTGGGWIVSPPAPTQPTPR